MLSCKAACPEADSSVDQQQQQHSEGRSRSRVLLSSTRRLGHILLLFHWLIVDWLDHTTAIPAWGSSCDCVVCSFKLLLAAVQSECDVQS